MRGIDVSKHQGKIDWQKVKASGVEFAIIRAGVGMYLNQEDSCFKTNVAGAVAAGIPVGVYWYSYALTPEEGKREAEVCLQVLSNFRDKIALPVWFDMEDADHYKKKHGFAFTRQNITDICRAFLQPVRAAGYRCGVYASKSWLESYIDVGTLDCEVWAAHWASKCGYTGKKLIWQYSSKGTVPGIAGNVDMDEGYEGLLPQVDGWKQIGNDWYYYRKGYAVKSQWIQDGGHKYYLSATGAMLTGVQKVGSKVYAFNTGRAEGVPRGAMIVTDSDGAVQFPK